MMVCHFLQAVDDGRDLSGLCKPLSSSSVNAVGNLKHFLHYEYVCISSSYAAAESMAGGEKKGDFRSTLATRWIS